MLRPWQPFFDWNRLISVLSLFKSILLIYVHIVSPYSRLIEIRGWVPFWVQSQSGLSPSRGWVHSGLSPSRGWVLSGFSPIRGSVPFGVGSIRGSVPFGVQSIRGWVPFGVGSIRDSVHSRLSLSRFGLSRFSRSRFSQWIAIITTIHCLLNSTCSRRRKVWCKRFHPIQKNVQLCSMCYARGFSVL
jgi:hypothetical protein